MQMARTGAIKIGRSSNVELRRRSIQTSCPYTVRTILVLPEQGHQERDLQRRLKRFRTRQYSGEWFEEAGLPMLPDDIYEQLDLESQDWWRTSPVAR